MEDEREVVIGVDIGTTSTKSVAYYVDGSAGPSSGVRYPMLKSPQGNAEQRPGDILAAVVETIATVAAQCVGRVAALSFSSAMHSVIGLDEDGEPITPVVTWADQRAWAQAERMRATFGGLDLHRRTGTPLHPMAPLPKLVWFQEEEPELAARVRHWVGIKEFVLLKLLGILVVDHSVASGTGLMNIHRLEWDAECLPE